MSGRMSERTSDRSDRSDRHAKTNERGSSNQQDTTVAPVEVAVQTRPLRSIPKALQVRPVLPSVVRQIVEERHYLRSMPAAPRCCFGVFLDDTLVGAVVFTSGPRNGHRLMAAAKPQDVAVLARLWLSDELPANSESRVIGVVLRHLRRHTGWKLILSYADPAAGHVGTIYQATGWRYLGQSEPNSYVDLGDGVLHHPRSIYTQFGSNSVGHLRATGVRAWRRHTSGKHRYAYPLDPAWAWRLQAPSLPYPQVAATSDSGATP